MEGNHEDNLACTPPEIREIAKNTVANLLPDKPSEEYKMQYQKFEKWCIENNIHGISENILIGYFELQRRKYKASTLWTIYSMLRSCLKIYKDVDISKYNKLQALLKRASQHYTPRKSKILEEDEINKFIQIANDKTYLAMKVSSDYCSFKFNNIYFRLF
jgi:site-specific recombinase XerD